MIRDAIALPLQHISTLDDEISRQEAVLAELKCKREGMTAYVTAHRGLLAPFRSVPEDILVEVFMHFKAGWGENARCSDTGGPLEIAGVCRHWRDVALHTPPLWSSIQIDTRRCRCEEDWTDLRYTMETWLERARSCPLSISIRGDTPGIDIFSNQSRFGRAAKEMIPVLLNSSVHWHNLYLDFFPGIEEHLAPIILPNLQHLSLQIINPPDTDGFHIFQTAPQLHSLTWSGYIGTFRDALQFLLPTQWDQLQVLDCGKQDWDRNHLEISDCLVMLSLTPNLHTARLYVSPDIGPTADIRARSVHLTKLRSLDVTCEFGPTFWHDPSVFLNCLRTPALASFKIAVAHSQGHVVSLLGCAPALAAFVSQCSALCKLVISPRMRDRLTETTQNSLFKILQNTPHLRRLVLGACRRETLSTDFLNAFAESDGVTPSTAALLPALTSLTLGDTGGPGIDITALINALRSRGSRGLRDVTVLSQRSYEWPRDIHDDREAEYFTGRSTLGLQDEDVIGRLRQLRDQVVNLKVLVEGKNVL